MRFWSDGALELKFLPRTVTLLTDKTKTAAASVVFLRAVTLWIGRFSWRHKLLIPRSPVWLGPSLPCLAGRSG
jgi:hypothetical protein